jgi:hypothetical protein
LAGIALPQPFLVNLPYGAEIKKSSIRTIAANEKIRMSETEYSPAIFKIKQILQKKNFLSENLLNF